MQPGRAEPALTRQHPPVALGAQQKPPAGLEWTVAQLLALFFRTGQKAADEVSLLAGLWVLESAHDSRHSGATNVIVRYVKLISAFFPEAARALCNNWPAALESMRAELVQAQLQLLTRLRWRVHLTLETDVEPCHRLLFGEPAAETCQPADSGCAAGRKAGSLSVRGLAGSKRGRPTLGDLEVLLASTRAALRGSVHSMATALREQASLLRRVMLGQAIKRGLCPPCAAEAKRRRTE
ncbi:sugar ABC transporter ATP-binding [Chlorella sorokiniana]|uniref:Sugar ABC transporter ATP-binding n=1 Tax=Chlorella sorokiniana TaxID=3076 RepID=A0A2P6TF64_CHLSO|nr:sugar ABC transporter ATP-binding [Chlorella sorokiniana]|eukprot:PRW32617.1 sugar ABC transporter ATP-binding [Chlorella sorokiniana]